MTCRKSAVLYWAADFSMTVVVLNFFCRQIPIYCEIIKLLSYVSHLGDLVYANVCCYVVKELYISVLHILGI